MSSSTGSSDVETTRYTIKANIETTKYFNPPFPDVEEQVNQNTTDINDIKTRLNDLSVRVTTDETNINELSASVSTNTSNINELSASVSTNISNINDLDASVLSIENTISSIPINPYEGLFYSKFANQYVIIEFNYGIGSLIFWGDGTGLGSYNTAINNVESGYHCELSDDIISLTLPGTIKKLNSDGSVNSVIRKLYYTLDPTTISGRKTLNNLKTITVLPDVWRIDFNSSSTPYLTSLNLFNGLEKISLTNAYNISHLKIPASVNECSISNCLFMNLTFEPSNIELKLTYTDNRINNKLKIIRKLSSDSTISVSNSSSIDYPPSVLDCDVRVLNKLSGQACLSNGTTNIDTFTTLILRAVAFDNTPVYMIGITTPLKFNRILDMCQLQLYVGVSNLTANEWFNGDVCNCTS